MCEGGNFNGPKGGKYYIINMKKTERSSGYDNFRKSRPVFTKKRSQFSTLLGSQKNFSRKIEKLTISFSARAF